MVSIENLHSVDFNRLDIESNKNGQVKQGTQVAHLATAELASIRSEALEETREGLSLLLSRYKKTLDPKSEQRDVRFDALEELLHQLSHEQATRVNQLVDTHALRGNSGDILSHLKAQGMDGGQLMLMLTALVMSGKLSEIEAKKLRKTLLEMLSEEGAEIALYAAMDGVALNESGLQALKQLYQQASRGETGLGKWFEEIRRLPDRRKKLRILLRALSEPLNDKAAARQMTKIVAVIADLRRLFIFLTIEDHSKMIAQSVEVESDDILVLTLNLIEQSWIYPQWLEDKIGQLNILSEKRINFLRLWKFLVSMMPVDCFHEDEQKENTEDVMARLLDEWCDDE